MKLAGISDIKFYVGYWAVLSWVQCFLDMKQSGRNLDYIMCRQSCPFFPCLPNLMWTSSWKMSSKRFCGSSKWSSSWSCFLMQAWGLHFMLMRMSLGPPGVPWRASCLCPACLSACLSRAVGPWFIIWLCREKVTDYRFTFGINPVDSSLLFCGKLDWLQQHDAKINRFVSEFELIYDILNWFSVSAWINQSLLGGIVGTHVSTEC